MLQSVFSKLPGRSQEFILDKNVDPKDLDTIFSELPEESTLVLVGSHAEGNIHKASDLDFILLAEEDESIVFSGATSVPHPTTLSDDYLILLEDLEINIEVINSSTLNRLKEAMSRFFAYKQTRAEIALPVLQILEIRFLDRLKNGLVLLGEARFREWQRALHVDLLVDYQILINFIGAMDYLEDSLSRVNSSKEVDLKTSLVMSRISAEGFLLAALATQGKTPHDIKSMPKYVERIKESGVDYPHILDEFERLLFPSNITHSDYFNLVYSSGISLFEYLKMCQDFVFPYTYLKTYGNNRWDLDLSFLHS